MLGWQQRRFGPSPGAMRKKVWSRHCTKSPGPANSERWTQARASGSSPWCAVRRPQGMARWSVRLIAEEAVKRKLAPQVGRETIRILLQSHELKPWREKNVVRGGTE